MYEAGRSNESPHIFSTTIWCDSPMPSDSCPPIASWTVRAWAASIMGWRGCTGTTAVPRLTSGSARPMIARTVKVSGPKICDAHMVSKPSSRSVRARSMVSSTELAISRLTAIFMGAPSCRPVALLACRTTPNLLRRSASASWAPASLRA